MHNLSPNHNELWPDQVARQIDHICDRFESAWQAASASGSRPSLVEFLPPESDTALPLVRELLQLDIDYRRRAGEDPHPEDYSVLIDKYRLELLDVLGEEAPEPRAKPQPCETPIEVPILTGLEIMEKLGKGSMGVVYKALDQALGRFVAIKRLISKAHSGREINRFYREARAAAQLKHPHVVPIYAVGQFEGEPCFTMPFLAGGSLAQHRDRYCGDDRGCVSLMEKIAHGVHAAHQAGIIHRDLKPGNILLDEAGEPFVADFGLAKLLGADESAQTGDILGTPGYMSPEQVAGRAHQVTATCDVWALGVILYELLLGQRPFVGTRVEVAHAIEAHEPSWPQILPSGLRTILQCCLEKCPSHRYATASALAADLHRWLDDKPVLGRQVSWYRKVEKIVRRRMSAFLALAILLVAFAGVALALAPPVAEMRELPEDPVRLDKEISDQLQQGGTVILLDDKNRSKPPRLAIDPSAHVNVPGADLSYTSCGLALILLLKDQPLSAFRMKAEVMLIRPGNHGRAGLFFNHGSHLSPEGEIHTFTDLTYTEPLSLDSRRIGLDQWQFRSHPTLDEMSYHVGEGNLLSLAKLARGDKSGVYRTLELVVETDQVSAFLDGARIQQMKRVDYLQARRFPRLSGVEPPELPAYPHGGVGLVVDHTSVAFKKVSIEPIKAK